MAADLTTIPLQPAGSSAFNPGPEHDTTTAKDNLVAGKPVIRLGDVSDPTLTFYPAPRGQQFRSDGRCVSGRRLSDSGA